MSQTIFDELFQNYTTLLARVDAHIAKVLKTQAQQITCKKGCDDCCRFLNLFPVEAFALSRAFKALPEKDQNRIQKKAEQGEDQCPLLIDHICMLYQARPVICRTHGFPIYMNKKGDVMVDFCPENFKGMTGLPKEVMLDLDQLNTLLSTVNQHFLGNLDADLPDRIPVSQALTLWDDLVEEE